MESFSFLVKSARNFFLVLYNFVNTFAEFILPYGYLYIYIVATILYIFATYFIIIIRSDGSSHEKACVSCKTAVDTLL